MVFAQACEEQFGAADDCLDVCATFTPGGPDDGEGDTAYCRLNHANIALMQGTFHCEHAQKEPLSVCTPMP